MSCFLYVRAFFVTCCLFMLGSCAGPPFGISPPFSYAEDRCVGEFNQCRTRCVGIPSGAARAACDDRCLANETQCYGSGPTGVGQSLSVEAAIADARNEREKEAAFQRWKRQKEIEAEKAAEKEAEEAASDESP